MKPRRVPFAANTCEEPPPTSGRSEASAGADWATCRTYPTAAIVPTITAQASTPPPISRIRAGPAWWCRFRRARACRDIHSRDYRSDCDFLPVALREPPRGVLQDMTPETAEIAVVDATS